MCLSGMLVGPTCPAHSFALQLVQEEQLSVTVKGMSKEEIRCVFDDI